MPSTVYQIPFLLFMKAETRFAERVSQAHELFHSIFNFATQSMN